MVNYRVQNIEGLIKLLKIVMVGADKILHYFL